MSTRTPCNLPVPVESRESGSLEEENISAHEHEGGEDKLLLLASGEASDALDVASHDSSVGDT